MTRSEAAASPRRELQHQQEQPDEAAHVASVVWAASARSGERTVRAHDPDIDDPPAPPRGAPRPRPGGGPRSRADRRDRQHRGSVQRGDRRLLRPPAGHPAPQRGVRHAAGGRERDQPPGLRERPGGGGRPPPRDHPGPGPRLDDAVSSRLPVDHHRVRIRLRLGLLRPGLPAHAAEPVLQLSEPRPVLRPGAAPRHAPGRPERGRGQGLDRPRRRRRRHVPGRDRVPALHVRPGPEHAGGGLRAARRAEARACGWSGSRRTRSGIAATCSSTSPASRSSRGSRGFASAPAPSPTTSPRAAAC